MRLSAPTCTVRLESPATSTGDGQWLPPLLELPELAPELDPELPEPELEDAPEVEDALELVVAPDVVLPLLLCVTDVLAVVRPPAPPPPVSPP